MIELFVDTSAWDAVLDAADPDHGAALQFRDEIVGQRLLVVTDYVLDELYTLVLMNLGYQSAVGIRQTLDTMAADGILDVVWVSEAIADEAWSVFERFNRDKKWSFTDCVSYAVMKQRGICEAFAFDHHFEQMGFVRRP